MINKLIDIDSNTIYNVEKVKLNKAPRHFFQDGVTVKQILINGEKVELRMRAERTQYVLFTIEKQNYYIRNHKAVEVKKFVTPTIAK